MGEARGWTYGLAAGAGLMFLLDPRQGGGRRALIRDKSRRAAHEVEEAARIGVTDLAHRTEGLVARLFGAGRLEEISDETLVERVRARLGHVCSHPQHILVTAKGHGEIELSGPIEAAEVDHVLSAIARVPGVRGIDDDLERVDRLPGGRHPRRSGLARVWNPSARLALGIASLGLAASSLLRARPLGFVIGSAGVLALARDMVTRGGIAGARRGSVLAHVASGAKKLAAGAVGPDGKPIVGLREAYDESSEWSPPRARFDEDLGEA